MFISKYFCLYMYWFIFFIIWFKMNTLLHSCKLANIDIHHAFIIYVKFIAHHLKNKEIRSRGLNKYINDACFNYVLYYHITSNSWWMVLCSTSCKTSDLYLFILVLHCIIQYQLSTLRGDHQRTPKHYWLHHITDIFQIIKTFFMTRSGNGTIFGLFKIHHWSSAPNY